MEIHQEMKKKKPILSNDSHSETTSDWILYESSDQISSEDSESISKANVLDLNAEEFDRGN